MCVDLATGTKYLGFFKLSTSDKNIWKASLYSFQSENWSCQCWKPSYLNPHGNTESERTQETRVGTHSWPERGESRSVELVLQISAGVDVPSCGRIALWGSHCISATPERACLWGGESLQLGQFLKWSPIVEECHLPARPESGAHILS